MVSPILHRATGTTVTQLIRAFCREQCPLSGRGGGSKEEANGVLILRGLPSQREETSEEDL